MVSREQLILLIQEYVSDDYLPTYTFFSARNGCFQEQSYLLWAAEELIDYILVDEVKTPMQALHDFTNQMKNFINLKPNYAFESAYQLASNILDVCSNADWD